MLTIICFSAVVTISQFLVVLRPPVVDSALSLTDDPGMGTPLLHGFFRYE